MLPRNQVQALCSYLGLLQNVKPGNSFHKCPRSSQRVTTYQHILIYLCGVSTVPVEFVSVRASTYKQAY